MASLDANLSLVHWAIFGPWLPWAPATIVNQADHLPEPATDQQPDPFREHVNRSDGDKEEDKEEELPAAGFCEGVTCEVFKENGHRSDEDKEEDKEEQGPAAALCEGVSGEVFK